MFVWTQKRAAFAALIEVFRLTALALVPLAALDGLFHLADGAGDLDAARAGWRAVIDGSAAPHAVRIGEDIQSLIKDLIAVIKDEAVRLHNGRRPDVLAVGPEAGAACSTRRAQDAFGRVVEAFAGRDGLVALADFAIWANRHRCIVD